MCNLCSRHRMMESYTLLASVLNETSVPSFCLEGVCKLSSLEFLHSLESPQESPFAQIFCFFCPGSGTSPVSRPNRLQKSGRRRACGNDHRWLGHNRNPMRAHHFPKPPDNSAIVKKLCLSTLHVERSTLELKRNRFLKN